MRARATGRARALRALAVLAGAGLLLALASVRSVSAQAVPTQPVPEVFAGLAWGERGDSILAKLKRVGFAPLGPVAPGNVVFVGGSGRDSQFVVATLDSTRQLRQVSTLTRAGAGRVLDVYQEILTALSMKHGPSERIAEQVAGAAAPDGGAGSAPQAARLAMRKWTLRRTTIVILISPRFDVVVAYDPIAPPSSRARLF